MTYVIAEPCELSCVTVCPVDCIHDDKGVDRMLDIDPIRDFAWRQKSPGRQARGSLPRQ